jgi:small neutral amino acid transporter SnatA (MarC family)
LVTPETAAVVLTAGSKEGVAGSAIAVAVAFALVVAAAALRRVGITERALARVGRLLAVFLVAAGIFLMVDGIRDV